jgi:hypothetical protein
MPKNNVSDLITDQEIAFARLVLSGTMTDRQAAEAVGLDPNSAAYIKSKPRVRAYMLEHRAAVQQQLVQQDTEELRRFNVSRDQILARLWEIANLEPERTRGSMSAQVKALSMIVAIEGLIPDRISARHSDRSAVSAQNPPPVNPPFYVAEWLRAQQDGESVDPQPSSAPAQEEAAAPEFQSAPARADDPRQPVSVPTPDPTQNLSESTFPGPLDASQTTSSPHPSGSAWVPDTRVPFSIDKNRFGRRR